MVSNERKQYAAQLVWTALVAVTVAGAGLYHSLTPRLGASAYASVAEPPEGAPRLEAAELGARAVSAARAPAREPSARSTIGQPRSGGWTGRP